MYEYDREGKRVLYRKVFSFIRSVSYPLSFIERFFVIIRASITYSKTS